jgi:hypothetical protein
MRDYSVLPEGGMTSLWIRMGELREIEAARKQAKETLGVEPFRTVAEIEAARAHDDP